MIGQAKRDRSLNSWRQEAGDLIRGASGGFLFGIPLLLTMEVWWIGSHAEPSRLLISLLTNFVVVFLLIRTEGFRRTSDVTLLDALIDSVKTLAIGAVCAGIVMVLIREITEATSLNEALGKIVFESAPFSLGVAVANSMLKGDRNANETEKKTADSHPEHPEINATLADIGVTLIGAIFVAFSIAPTEEVPMIASAITPPWLLLMLAASLLISYGIVFVSGLTNQDKRHQQQGLFQRPISETVAAYLVSLGAAALMLWFFHQLSIEDPWTVWLSHSIVLGFPASIGGAAGRIVV